MKKKGVIVGNDDFVCPASPPREKEYLRSCPSNTFSHRHEYSRERWVKEIEQEQQEAHKLLKQKCKAQDRRPHKDEYFKICQEIERKYRERDYETDAKVYLWERSERMLGLLRTKGRTPTPDDAKHQALFKFVQTIQLERFPELNENFQRPSPNQYFEHTQPELVAQYGLPFYATLSETINPESPDRCTVIPVERITGINTEFFSGYLGGDKRLGHDCVFYVPESAFYFYDLVLGCYVPTSEEKVRLVLSQAIQQRAWGQEMATATLLLEKYRTKAIFNEIIANAKALLAADAGFFHGPDARPRWQDQQESVAKTASEALAVLFVNESLEPADGEVLPVKAVLERFREHSGQTNVTNVALRAQVELAVTQVYGRGIRNDLRQPDGSCVAAWRGLTLRPRHESSAQPVLRNKISPSSVASVLSEQSVETEIEQELILMA